MSEKVHQYFDIEVSHDEYLSGRYDRVRKVSQDTVPEPRYGRDPFTYNDTPEIVHTDHYAEHVTKVIVVTGPNERIVLNSRSGVLWYGHETDTDTTDRTALRLAVSLAETGVPRGEDQCEVERPDGFCKPLSGWHSSMERSEQSDMLNALAQADTPPEWGSDMFPYAVRFGDTRNVCSVNASLYAKQDVSDTFKELFDGKRSRPIIGAGFD